MLARVNDIVGLRDRLPLLLEALAPSNGTPASEADSDGNGDGHHAAGYMPLLVPTHAGANSQKSSTHGLAVPPSNATGLVEGLFGPTHARLSRAAAALCGFIAVHLVFVQVGELARRLYVPDPSSPERRLAAMVGRVAGSISLVRHRVARVAVDAFLFRSMESVLEAWCRAVLFPPPSAKPLEPGFAYMLRQDLDCVKGAFSAEEAAPGAVSDGGIRRGLPPRIVAGMVQQLQALVASSVALDAGKLADAYMAARETARRDAHAGKEAGSDGIGVLLEDATEDEAILLGMPSLRSFRAVSAARSSQTSFALVLLRRGEAEARRFATSAKLAEDVYGSFVRGAAK